MESSRRTAARAVSSATRSGSSSGTNQKSWWGGGGGSNVLARKIGKGPAPMWSRRRGVAEWAAALMILCSSRSVGCSRQHCPLHAGRMRRPHRPSVAVTLRPHRGIPAPLRCSLAQSPLHPTPRNFQHTCSRKGWRSGAVTLSSSVGMDGHVGRAALTTSLVFGKSTAHRIPGNSYSRPFALITWRF